MHDNFFFNYVKKKCFLSREDKTDVSDELSSCMIKSIWREKKYHNIFSAHQPTTLPRQTTETTHLMPLRLQHKTSSPPIHDNYRDSKIHTQMNSIR